MKLSIRVHWLSFTVFDEIDGSHEALWAELFQDYLGVLVDKDYGTQWHTNKAVSASGCTVCYGNRVAGRKHYTVDIPGSACECLTPDVFRDLYAMQKSGLAIKITRLDVAVDGGNFSPLDVFQRVKAFALGSDESLDHCAAQLRRTKPGHNGKLPKIYGFHSNFAGDTAEVGSRSSGRFLRVYNERGFTRCEMEFKKEWAEEVFILMMQHRYAEWLAYFLGVLNDFLSIPADWWHEFVKTMVVSDIIISSARVISLSRLEAWIQKQVAPALIVLSSFHDNNKEFMHWIGKDVTIKKLDRYRPILEVA